MFNNLIRLNNLNEIIHIKLQKNMETKYTNDGKKVVIIGNLNSQEKIVQEIYVTANGQEIPSGENFVVKSLHDEPVKTWSSYYQNRIKTLEENAKKNFETLEKTLSDKRNKLEDVSKQLSDKIKWAASALKELTPDTFDFLVKFCEGKLNTIVVHNYSGYEIMDMDGYMAYNDSDGWSGRRYKNLRLLSLYGRSEGKMEWLVNDYSDGSGSSRTVWFFESEKEAIKFVADQIAEKKSIGDADIKLAEKYEFELPKDKLKAYYDTITESNKKRIDELRQKLAEAELEFKNNPHVNNKNKNPKNG